MKFLARRSLLPLLLLLALLSACGPRPTAPPEAGSPGAATPAAASPDLASASPAAATPEAAAPSPDLAAASPALPPPSDPAEAPALGSEAPDFTLPVIGPGGAQSEFQLSKAGAPVVLLFYPAAFTPGCTMELCGFRDGYEPFRKAGVIVLPVSADPPDSLTSFTRSEGLPFALGSDPRGEVASLYASWAGDGARRTMYVIGKDGAVRYQDLNVDLGKLDKVIATALQEATR